MQLLQARSTIQDPLPNIIDDPLDDLAFASRAAIYLEKKGLNHRAVVQCLIEEFELDQETAEAVASLAA